jgi:hypothetical protein
LLGTKVRVSSAGHPRAVVPGPSLGPALEWLGLVRGCPGVAGLVAGQARLLRTDSEPSFWSPPFSRSLAKDRLWVAC